MSVPVALIGLLFSRGSPPVFNVGVYNLDPILGVKEEKSSWGIQCWCVWLSLNPLVFSKVSYCLPQHTRQFRVQSFLGSIFSESNLPYPTVVCAEVVSCLAMQGGGNDWESYFSFYRLSTNPPIFRPILYPYTLWGTWYLWILSPSGVLRLELHCFVKTLGFTFLYSANLVYHSFICLWFSNLLSILSPSLVSSVLFMLVRLQFLFYLYWKHVIRKWT